MYTCVSFLCAVFTPKEKPPIDVVGDVGGRIAIIVVSVYTQDDFML